MSEIHIDDTYLNRFGQFWALLGSFGVKMFQNGQKWHLEGSRAQNGWNKLNKCWNRMVIIRTDHYDPFLAQKKANCGAQKVQKWH